MTSVLSILLAVAFLGAGAPKLVNATPMLENFKHLGVPLAAVRVTGALEVAGAAGLLVGLAVHVIGGLAALGLLVVSVLAVLAHLRPGDRPVTYAPAAILGVLALIVTVARL